MNSENRHMYPFAENDDFIEYELGGETFVIPAEHEDVIPADEGAEVTERFSGKWFARMSAPGYTDCTDWEGPYNTEDGALWQLYQFHGDGENDTFSAFIGEGKKIVKGSLRLTGTRSELYGTVAGEKAFDTPIEVHLATMGDVDIDEETGDPSDYDPNEDWDLEDAYGFELVTPEEAQELTQRFINAENDTDE